MLSRPETLLLKKLTDEINNRTELIASGTVTDYSEYKLNVGFITGLRTAIELLHETNREITGS
jgi:hypothetical protein